MYIRSRSGGEPAGARLGVLYPGYSAEDDYGLAAELLGPDVTIDLVHTTIGEDAHREDALRDTGDLGRLLEGARELSERRVDVAMWACTSGSFVFGLEGAREQAAAVEAALGVPASSTSLAFAAALEHLGIDRVEIVATYPAEVAAMFAALLADAGVSSVAVRARGIIAGADVGRLGHLDVLAMLDGDRAPEAGAVLLPDTALHSIAWLEELERHAKKPVLTANQVTVWQGLRLAGLDVSGSGLGSLFEVVGTTGTSLGARPR